MSTTTGAASPLRRMAAVLVGVEALALAAIAVWTVLDPSAGATSGAMAAAIAALASVVALALGWGSVALWRGRTWPRGLAVTWQVMQAAVGFTVMEWSTAVGVAAIVVAVAAAVALVTDARRDASV